MAMALPTWSGAKRGSAEILRSYAQVFFAHSPWVGLLLALATATEPATFVFGALAVLVAALLARALGLDGDLRASGYFGYNAFLVGAGIGHLYPGTSLSVPMAILACAVSVILTSALRAWLTRHFALPVLSLPFLAVFWLVVWAAPTIGLLPTLQPARLPESGSPILEFLQNYACCLGSVLFVPSVQAGVLVAIALLLHSRIASLLAFGTFALLSSLNAALPLPLPASVFAGLVANAMLLCMAVGGVWFLPSRWSVVGACAATLACVLVTAGLYRPFAAAGLPVLFLPFNLLSFALLLAARERARDAKPKSVDFLPGSPEENLHYVLNQRVRFPESLVARFYLPFRGRWICTQGVDGEHTHQGLWRYAFDFQVEGDDGELFTGSPAELTSYHCYKLPVLATAAGVVVKIENDIPDNPIGDMDLVRNWGNVVILQHGAGVYSLVAHLARRSIKVKEGQQVAPGEVLGLCGNSGRSPTPHIHFQLQTGPYPGADTLAMVFSDTVISASIGERLEIAHIPVKGDTCRNIEPSPELAERLCPRPGDTWRMQKDELVEEIGVNLNLLGQVRLKSTKTTSLDCTRTPYVQILHDPMPKTDSVLFLLRAALPRVPLEDNVSLLWKDHVPAQLALRPSWLASFVSLIVSRPGLAMSYTLHKQAGNIVIEGVSPRQDKGGVPLLRTRIVFDAEVGPLSIQVQLGGGESRALRSTGAGRLAAASVTKLAEFSEDPPPDIAALDPRHDRVK